MSKIVSHVMQCIFLSLFATSALVAAAPTLSFPATSNPPATQTPTDLANAELLKASATAAAQWLAMVDAGQYDMSWNYLSLRLQLIFPKDSWVTYLKSMRAPLGNTQSRAVALQSPAENPKGLAPGLYMLILYNTTFSRQGTEQELVTLVLENNVWRVLSYNIGKIQ